jgi:hypothetical protein
MSKIKNRFDYPEFFKIFKFFKLKNNIYIACLEKLKCHSMKLISHNLALMNSNCVKLTTNLFNSLNDARVIPTIPKPPKNNHFRIPLKNNEYAIRISIPELNPGMFVEVHAEVVQFGENLPEEAVYVLKYDVNDVHDFYTRMNEKWCAAKN